MSQGSTTLIAKFASFNRNDVQESTRSRKRWHRIYIRRKWERWCHDITGTRFCHSQKNQERKRRTSRRWNCPTFWIVQLFQAGQQLEFKCNPGYRLIGERYLTCLDIGVWDHKRPSCTPYECPLPKQCVL